MKLKKPIMLVIATAVALGSVMLAGCSKEPEPEPVTPAAGAGAPPEGAGMGTAQPTKAPTGPDGGPP